MNEQKQPLVTVAVIAYKASCFIEETLNSIRNQTYRNIELIISDDASPDNTLEICQQWIGANKNRFVSVKIITVEKNTGVAGNCKRALAASTGYYYKGIGSDDILTPDCIEKFVTFFQINPEIRFSFAKEIRFTGDFKEQHFEYPKFPFRALCFSDSITAQQQLNTLTKTFIGIAPTAFAETKLLNIIGIDEQYSTEDGPLYINLTKAGIKLYFMDTPIVYRRVHEQSLTHKKNQDSLLTGIYYNSKKKSWRELQYKYASPFWRWAHRYNNWIINKIFQHGNNKHSIRCRIYDFIRRWINPFKLNLIWMNIKEKVLTIL